MEYAWSFPTLDVVYNEDGFAQVVKTVHWRYKATDGDYTAESYGTISLTAPGQPFTDFDDLTPEIVTGWVTSVMGEEQVAAMDAALASQIDAKKNPVSGSVAPPWVAA